MTCDLLYLRRMLIFIWVRLSVTVGQQWQAMLFAFVWRTPNGPIDTLGWEGYREGVDDARYLATLLDAMNKAKTAGSDAAVVAQTQRWVATVERSVEDVDDRPSERPGSSSRARA